jgi:hypothetical protein
MSRFPVNYRNDQKEKNNGTSKSNCSIMGVGHTLPQLHWPCTWLVDRFAGKWQWVVWQLSCQSSCAGSTKLIMRLAYRGNDTK